MWSNLIVSDAPLQRKWCMILKINKTIHTNTKIQRNVLWWFVCVSVEVMLIIQDLRSFERKNPVLDGDAKKTQLVFRHRLTAYATKEHHA